MNWELGDHWVNAKNLNVGDKLLLSDGQPITIDSIIATKLDTPVRVYNFEVEDFHTYFVSNNAILVQNVCIARDGHIKRKSGLNEIIRHMLIY